MGTPVKPSQERSRRRREALLDATIEVFAEGGVKAVTHRAVATRAGLPLASTTYYFGSIQELIEEALARHVRARVTELEELAVAVAAGGRTADEIARRFAERLVERRSDVLVGQYELYLEAARNPTLREPVADALAAFERLAGAVLEFLGARDPDAVAESLVAVLDGFALHRVARPRSREVEIESLFDAMRALLIYHAMDDDERDVWNRRFQVPLTGLGSTMAE